MILFLPPVTATIVLFPPMTIVTIPYASVGIVTSNIAFSPTVMFS